MEYSQRLLLCDKLEGRMEGDGRKTQKGGNKYILMASLLAQMVKNLPAIQETLDQSLGREDPLEKRMATYFSFLAWKIP